MKSLGLFTALFFIVFASCHRSKGEGKLKIIEFTDQSVKVLHDSIQQEFDNGNTPILYYTAGWCAPCNKIKKSIEAGNVDKYSDITIIRIDEQYFPNGTKNPIWEHYRVRSIPTIIEVDHKYQSVNKANNRKWRNPNKKLDPFLKDLYPGKTEEELVFEKQKEDQRRKSNEFESAFAQDAELSDITKQGFRDKQFDTCRKDYQNYKRKIMSLSDYEQMYESDFQKMDHLTIKIDDSEQSKILIKKLGNFSHLSNLQSIEITGHGEVPEAIYSLEQLKAISINGSSPGLVLSEKLNNLVNLEVLLIGFGETSLPSSISGLRNLRYFRSFSEMRNLPRDFFELKKLRSLYLNHSPSVEIANISNLTNLEYLNINSFDPGITKLANLKILKIQNVDEADFTGLNSLEYIFLTNTTYQSLPESLATLPSLAGIYLSSNYKLTKVSDLLTKAPRLKYFYHSYLESDPKVDIPEQIRQMPHFVSYYRT